MLKPLFALSALLFVGLGFSKPTQTPAAPTPIPAEATARVNPVHPTPESLAHAKKMYGYDCAMCHGARGDGKGEMVDSMKLTVKDLTDPNALKDLTDGDLFYIIKNGRGQMPGEGDRQKDAEIWNMVLVVRSFAKK